MKPPFRSILCPTDLSPLGNLAVSVGYLLAAKGGTVHLVHVDEPPRTGNPLYPDEKPKGAPTAPLNRYFRRRACFGCRHEEISSLLSPS